MAFIDLMKEKARQNRKTIVLPESEDQRTLTAAAQILKEECDKIGVPAIIQPFEIEQGIVEKATLEILEPFQMEVPVTGYQ